MGPTTSGKSALALQLAKRFGGLIINADSMQVYRDLRVLTARPSEADEAAFPHRLYGTVDGATAWSVSRWLEDVAFTLREASELRLLPILVGGTGLYFKALTQGLSAIPPVPAAVRAEVRALADRLEPAALHELLEARDPSTASRLRPSDPQRIVRALEVHHATGRGLATFHDSSAAPLLPLERTVAVALTVGREALRARVDARFDRMVGTGAIYEIETLAKRALDPTLPIMRALGVPPLLRAVAGDLDLDAAVARAKLDTRRYLKRQDTFVRHQLPRFRPVAPDDAEAVIVAQLA